MTVYSAWTMRLAVTMKELKSGWHLGQIRVTRDAERVTRSMALSVLASLLFGSVVWKWGATQGHDPLRRAWIQDVARPVPE